MVQTQWISSVRDASQQSTQGEVLHESNFKWTAIKCWERWAARGQVASGTLIYQPSRGPGQATCSKAEQVATAKEVAACS
jgi:hypothetical protein